MVNPIDEDTVQQLEEFNGKKLKSTTKEGLDIEDDDEKNKLEELKAIFEPLTKLMKEVIGDQVEKVVISRHMVDSPCVPTTSLHGSSATIDEQKRPRTSEFTKTCKIFREKIAGGPLQVL